MITTILFTTAFVSLLYLAVISLIRPRNFPPGPLGLPFFGSFYQIIPDITKKSQKLFEIYGNIFSVKMKSSNFVCIRGYDLIKEVMVDNPKPYSNRLSLLSHKLVRGPNLEGIASARYGLKWSTNRKLFHMVVRKKGFQNFDNIIVEEVPYFIEELQKHQQSDATVNPSEVFEFAVLNILAYFVFGNRYSYGDPKFKRLMKLNSQFFKSISGSSSMAFLLVSFVPFLHKIWLPKGNRQLVACSMEIQAFVTNEVEYHQSTLDPEQPRDFIDYYLIEMMNQNSSLLSKLSLVMCVMDFFQAGTETTSTTLNWAVLYMANNLEIQKKVQSEIDTVLGPYKSPTYEDRVRMPYTEATIMEVQRKSNIAPLGLIHATKEKVKLGGYDLPEGTAVVATYNSIHHSPEHWKTPNQFDPENFLDPDGKVGARPAFMPFGGGLRICLGMNVAKQELFLFFVTMLQHFTFLPPPGVLKLDEDYVSGVTLQPKPYKVVMKRRV